MSESDEGQGPAEAAALLTRVDAYDVDLADRRAAFAATRVHLRPVKPREPAVPFRQEEAGRVKPGLGLPQPQIRDGPPALLGVVGERAAVDREPGLLVGSRLEGADRHAGRSGRGARG